MSQQARGQLGRFGIWQYEAHQVAASFQQVEERFPGRFLLTAPGADPAGGYRDLALALRLR